VEVSPDDDETALRVTLLRAGTPAERAAAEQALDESAIRAPRAADLSKPRTVTVRETAPAESEAEPEPEKASAGADSPADAVSTPAEPRSSRPGTDEEIIRDARAAATAFSASLPSFLVQQATTRYFSTSFPARWQPIDVVTAELAYNGGKEEYRNIQIDGRPANGPIERTGAWSTGEFGSTLEDLMSTSTNAAFHRRAEERMASRAALVYDFTVTQPNSHWVLVSPDDRRYNPAYEGAIWIDKETRRVLRIEQRTTFIPREFPFSRAESILNYAFAKIEQQTYLLPAAGENIGCMSGSGSCTRNAIEFRDYRKFTVESKMKY
jgi:hypothetical protein